MRLYGPARELYGSKQRTRPRASWMDPHADATAPQGADELGHGAEVGLDPDDEAEADEVLVAACFRGTALGFAFMEGSTLHVGQMHDSPDFRMLQTLKLQLKPTTVVTPSNVDPLFLAALKTSCLVLPGAAVGGTIHGDSADEPMGLGQEDDENRGGGGGGPRVIQWKSRDFASALAAKRLCLLHSRRELPDDSVDERDLEVYLEHMVPREHEQARRAIAGLLSHLQGTEGGASALAINSIRRFALENQLYMAPEAFLSLDIFKPALHPSAHGGKGKEGFSVWTLMNRTRSKPGERVLRQWFARPTQELAILRERHEFIEVLTRPQMSALLSQLHGIVGRTKDVSKLEASLNRGGLLLSDFNAVMLTASCAIRCKEVLTASEAPTDLPAISRCHRAFNVEMVGMLNMVANVIDFEASSQAGKTCPGAARHICVRDGVHEELDRLRGEYEDIEDTLTSLAMEEKDRLQRLIALPRESDLQLVYVPQLGFLLKLQIPNVGSDCREQVEETCAQAGLHFQFEAEGSFYFKGGSCAHLDTT